jgi:flagellin-like hook-associated protein FlgL
MADKVALGAAMTNNLLSLQKTNSMLESTQLRLATGRKVNSALDNPLSFFTAQSLSNRSSDLGRLLDSMGQSISSIKQADKGVTSMTKLIEQAQATVSDARDSIAAGFSSSATGNKDIGGAATMATLGVTTGATFQITVGDAAAVTVTTAGADTGAALVGKINTAVGATATASLDANGQLSIVATDSSEQITFGGGTFTKADYAAIGLGAVGDTVDKVKTLENNYNEVRSQIDALVKDANYRGTNLLGGDTLTTFFNEDRTNKLVTTGQDLTASGLGLSAADFRTATKADAADSNVRSALAKARDFGSAMANSLAILQTREDFTKQTMQVLEEGADKLTLADPNEEGARMLALQTRLQLGVTSLSLAAQSQQSVLSMF